MKPQNQLGEMAQSFDRMTESIATLLVERRRERAAAERDRDRRIDPAQPPAEGRAAVPRRLVLRALRADRVDRRRLLRRLQHRQDPPGRRHRRRLRPRPLHRPGHGHGQSRHHHARRRRRRRDVALPSPQRSRLPLDRTPRLHDPGLHDLRSGARHDPPHERRPSLSVPAARRTAAHRDRSPLAAARRAQRRSARTPPRSICRKATRSSISRTASSKRRTSTAIRSDSISSKSLLAQQTDRSPSAIRDTILEPSPATPAPAPRTTTARSWFCGSTTSEGGDNQKAATLAEAAV